MEDLAWANDHAAAHDAIHQGSAAAEQIRKEVESWQEPILDLIIAVDDAALLLADTASRQQEEKTSQGGTLFDLVVDTILDNTQRRLDGKSPDEP